MSRIARAWWALFFHSDRRYFNLPRTEYELPEPPNEGPWGIALPRAQGWANRITRGGSHGTPVFYAGIGVILAVITLLEVWLFTLDGLGGWYVPLLLLLSAAKFFLVVGFYMHLRFDNRLFAILFGTGFALSVIIFVGLIALFEKLTG